METDDSTLKEIEAAAAAIPERPVRANHDLMRLMVQAWQYAVRDGAPMIERLGIDPPSAALIQEARFGQAADRRARRRRLTLESVVGVLPVLGDGERWWPPEGRDDTAAPAVIQPVLAASPWGWPGGLVDLVAWHPAKPERWRLLTGLATHLGFWPCEAPGDEDAATLTLTGTPMDWLEQPRSVCLLSYAEEVLEQTTGYAVIRCGHAVVAELVRGYHMRQLPQIRVA